MKKTLLIAAILSAFTSGVSPDENPLLKNPAIARATEVQEAMRLIYREVNSAVVRIETEDTVKLNHPLYNDPMFRFFFNVPKEAPEQKRQGLGSGFVISADGFIITNNHVVARQGEKNKFVDKIKIKFVDGSEYAARVVGADQASDLAVLKISPNRKLKTVYIGNSDAIEVGDFAIAIGNPFGLSSTFTMGIISSKGQEVETQDGIPRIQTDAPINPGNSGGPLLNIRGEVIGINQMIFSQSGGSVGIGFAIPINYAMTIAEKLKTGQVIKHGYIGVSVFPDVSPEQLKELKINAGKGLLVNQVILGSPAWKAGVRPYDYITHVDGKVAEKFSDLKSAVLRKGVGKSLQLKVTREGKHQTFDIVVGEAKS